jgi:penicillin-binding protein 1A
VDVADFLDAVKRAAVNLGGVIAVMAGMVALLLVFLVPGIVGAQVAVDTVEEELLDVPPLPEEIAPLAQNSFVYDRHGELMTELHGPVQRIVAEIEEIPEVAQKAVIATEDARFYEHGGVDHEGVLRAAVRNFQQGRVVEGASTITQQYIREALLTAEQTMERKIQEAIWAVELERRVSKDEILERYMNAVYLGNGAYGFATAARYYFSKDVSELTLAESAMLAGSIRAPELNNPVANLDAAAVRRDIVIRQMLRAGFIDEDEAEEALEEEIELDIYEPDVGEPFWEDWIKRIMWDSRVALQPEIQEILGESTEERIRAVFEGGLRVTTTLDPDMQALAQETISAYLTQPETDPMGSIISLDHTTGAVHAMALGPKEFGPCPEDEEPCLTTNVNPAVPGIGGSGRQSGSAFKPLISATALALGIGTSREYGTASGEPIEGCGARDDPYAPHNYDRADHGDIAMHEAMRRSINVYFVKLARDAGIGNVVEASRQHGIRNSANLNDAHFGSRSCSIGLGTPQVFPLEMAVAYATWANGGERCDPYVVERIEDHNGEVIYEHEERCEVDRVALERPLCVAGGDQARLSQEEDRDQEREPGKDALGGTPRAQGEDAEAEDRARHEHDTGSEGDEHRGRGRPPKHLVEARLHGDYAVVRPQEPAAADQREHEEGREPAPGERVSSQQPRPHGEEERERERERDELHPRPHRHERDTGREKPPER